MWSDREAQMPSDRYEELARREGAYWGSIDGDAGAPQIWHDPGLQEIFFGAEERRFVDRIAALGPRALELGCGHGELAIAVAERGLEVTAIDLSEERIAGARARAPSGNPAFLVGDLNRMRLPDGPFDVVVAHDALHHLVDLDHVLAEVERVLRPGGALLVYDFRGMGKFWKALSAALYAVLPTRLSYAEKWRLRKGLAAFLEGERAKRAALEQGGGAALHPQSPFEGISQESIEPAIARRFDVIERREFCPFFFYLAPKLRLPAGLRLPVARALRRAEDVLRDLRLARGAYFVMECRRRAGA
jgi:SAM-dependent methyltransferase